MKIRNGFVSNSSSSSFIISVNDFPTVRSLATYMLNKKIEEYEEYRDHDEYDEDDYDKTLIERLQNIDEDQSLSFSSCNYDTYIRKIKDCYLVATCNNTSWDLVDYTTRLTKNDIEELKKLQNTYIKNSDDYENIQTIIDGEYYEFYAFGNDFYSLDKELIGIETYEYCPNHEHQWGYNLWDLPKYGKICLSCSPLLKRKEKLENINNISENE